MKTNYIWASRLFFLNLFVFIPRVPIVATDKPLKVNI